MRDEWIVLGTSAELEAQLVEFERLHPGGTFSFPGGAVCRNVVFYSFLDTAITSLLITAGLLDWVTSVNVVRICCRLMWPRIIRLRWKSGLERPRPSAV